MVDLTNRLLALASLLMSFYVRGETTLLCYCTESDCLSKGTNMCVQKNANFGCYKQFYHRDDPPITMGCVNSNLLCDHHLRPVGISLQDWPYTSCCTESYCNKDLPIPAIYTANSSQSTSTTPAGIPIYSEPSTHHIQLVVTNVAVTLNSENADGNTSDGVHPVFLLLILLVIIFTIVVVISLLVIIKIWLYGRKFKPVVPAMNNYRNNSRAVIPVDRQSSALLPEKNWTGCDPNQSKSLLPSSRIWGQKQDRLSYDTSESTLNESV